MKMELYRILERVAEPWINNDEIKNGIPAGHNGLYHDSETRARNTSHWLVTLTYLYKHTNNDKYIRAAKNCASFLQNDHVRPTGATFHHRDSKQKDHCNGLIGQAWTIEALAESARILNQPDLSRLAEDVFLLHPQDGRTGFWKRVEVNGQILPFDGTFNHQLWFAAAGGLLANLPWSDSQIDDQVQLFLDELESNIRLYPSGLIFHPLKPVGLKRLLYLIRTDKQGRIGLTFITGSIPLPSRRQQLEWKAIGYHAFNLYAFALLKQQYPEHGYWETAQWKRALKYIRTREYQDAVWQNEYGSSYNPVGFEVAFVMEVFDIGSVEERRWWVEKQLKCHYNPKTDRMDRNTEDGHTLTARIYEAARLENIQLSNFNL